MCLSVRVYVQFHLKSCLGVQPEPFCKIHTNMRALINSPPTGLNSSVVRPR